MSSENNVLSLAFSPLDLEGKSILYLNAQLCDAVQDFQGNRLDLQQYFKPDSDRLEHAGLRSEPDFPDSEAQYDAVVIQGTKNATETKYLIARAVAYLKKSGQISVCAENKSGGNRLAKLLKEIGFDNVDHYSKHKAKVCWATKETVNTDVQNAWLSDAKPQCTAQGYYTIPGIFGWNKIDKGSSILLDHIPKPNPQNKSKILKGRGADFGCGYGYLSKEILQRYDSIKSLTCIDADHRALKACRENTQTISGDVKMDVIWADLTKKSPVQNLDFVIMNPPFHEGKTTDDEIGKAFIQNAHTALKKHGHLFMVSNNHLSYEQTLEDNFYHVEKLYEGQGFKVFQANK